MKRMKNDYIRLTIKSANTMRTHVKYNTGIEIPPLQIKNESLEVYMENILNQPNIKEQIAQGIVHNMQNNYPGMFKVYTENLQAGIITVCATIMKRSLDSKQDDEIEHYINHSIIHEITHITINQVQEVFSVLYAQCMAECSIKQSYIQPECYFAEKVADLLIGAEPYNTMAHKLWRQLWTP